MAEGSKKNIAPKSLTFFCCTLLAGMVCLTVFMPASVYGTPAATNSKESSASKKIEAYVLKQNGKTVGPQLITIAASGLRCEALHSHVVLLCSAPDFQVLLYSAETKRCKTTPFKLYRGYLQKQMALFSGQSYFDKPVVLRQKSTFFALPGSLYQAPRGYPQKMMTRYMQHQVTGGEPAEITYKVLNLPGVAQELESVLERYYSVPEKGGVPLEYSWLAVNNERRSFLTTSAAQKQTVSQSLFTRPEGLIESKTIEEVFLDSRSDGSDDILNMFGKK